MPKPFNKLTAIAAPIMRSNIDTDVIIRIERLVGNSIRGTLGKWAFGSLRYLPDGSENPEFILNREPYRQAEILITGPNFGCGSSREGAVWSLQEMGIRAVIGSGFGDIFFANCFQNGILPIVVDKEIVDGLAAEVEADAKARGASASISRRRRSPRRRERRIVSRSIRAVAKACCEGLDEVALTLQRDDEIRAFQAADRDGAALDPFCREIGMNTRSNMIKVAVVGGEGIGPEVTAQSHRMLNWFAAKRGVPMTLREAQYGIIPYLATGKVLPDDTVEAMEEADAILWGATGGPETKEVPPAARKAGSLLALRSKYDLYANLRPIVANPALADSAPLKAHVLKDVDFVIIRELTSGIYFGEPRGIETLRRRAAPRLQHRAIHHQPDPPRRALGVRAGAHPTGTRSARSTRPMCWRPACCGARKSSRCTRKNSPTSSSPIMYVDNAAMQIVRDPRAVRRDGDRQYLRRHPVGLRGDGVGFARHAAVGLARAGRQLRPPQGAVRAGARQRT